MAKTDYHIPNLIFKNGFRVTQFYGERPKYTKSSVSLDTRDSI